jgi:hypothetical protein
MPAEIKALRRCDSEGRDGTKLPACFKVYLPAPSGRFGMVPLEAEDATALRLDPAHLSCIALADFPGATAKARRDAPATAVSKL